MSLARAVDSIDRIITKKTERVAYTARWAGRVIRQNALGTLEVLLDRDKIPGEAGVAIRPGLPGVTVKVSSGVRCEVGYANFDARCPVSCGWEPGPANAADELELETKNRTAFKSAGQPAVEHLLTVEQFVNLMGLWALTVLPTVATPAAIPPTPPYPSDASPVTAAMVAWVQAAAASGVLPASLSASLQAAIAAQPTKSEATAVLAPGIACKGLRGG